MSDVTVIAGRPELGSMEFAIFAFDWLGKPVWMWLTFLSIVIALLVFDLGVLHRDNHEIEVKESLLLSTTYIGIGPASSSKRRLRSTTSSSSRSSSPSLPYRESTSNACFSGAFLA